MGSCIVQERTGLVGAFVAKLALDLRLVTRYHDSSGLCTEQSQKRRTWVLERTL